MYIVMEVHKFSESLKTDDGVKLRIENEPLGFCAVFETREQAETFAKQDSSIYKVEIKQGETK